MTYGIVVKLYLCDTFITFQLKFVFILAILDQAGVMAASLSAGISNSSKLSSYFAGERPMPDVNVQAPVKSCFSVNCVCGISQRLME